VPGAGKIRDAKSSPLHYSACAGVRAVPDPVQQKEVTRVRVQINGSAAC
jgi:hypothetical protein